MQKFDYEFTRVNNDVNGNPRYVVHYLALLTDKEKYGPYLPNGYEIALRRSRAFGGKKYRGKGYGGGIVFQSYNTQVEAEMIARIVEQASKEQE
jgi:hypothetical protein